MKISTLSLSLLLSIILFASCNKDGAMGEVNFGKLEGKTWVADRTATLLNGQESGSVPNSCRTRHMNVKSVLFSNGNATIMNDSETYVYPYSVVDGIINISGMLGLAITFKPTKITNKELVVEEGEEELQYISDTEEVLVEPVEIARENGLPIYHFVYKQGGIKYDAFYLDNNNKRVRCTLQPNITNFHGFYANLSYFQTEDWFQKQSLSREELFLLMRGILNGRTMQNDMPTGYEQYIKQLKELGYTEEESIYLLYINTNDSGYGGRVIPQNIVEYIQRSGKTDIPELTNDVLISTIENSSRYIKEDYVKCWELYKLYAEKSGMHFCDGIIRHYFSAR